MGLGRLVRNAYRILVRKPLVKRSVGRPRRWEDNINGDFWVGETDSGSCLTAEFAISGAEPSNYGTAVYTISVAMCPANVKLCSVPLPSCRLRGKGDGAFFFRSPH